MTSCLMLSLFAVLLGVPLHAAGDAHPGRGLRRALAGVLAYAFIYWWVVLLATPEP